MRLITNENSSKEAFEEKLRYICEPVDKITNNLQNAALEMLRIMYGINAIGLAANQVGLKIKLCVIDPAWMGGIKMPIIMFNPEYESHDEENFVSPEGCLSLPGVGLQVPRFRNVKVKYLGFDGKYRTIKDDNSLLSSVLQHEIDHLNGILFTDRVSEKVEVEYKKLP